ncbi:hypothetical protein IJZ97_04795 [bacterium]|nr:hypothetical protein [bacterium]
MGKNSKYPSYPTGSVTVNGNTVANTSKKGNTITSNYNMSDVEKGIYDYAQNSLLGSLPQINVFSKDTQNSINSQVEAYKNKGLQTINDTYAPLLNDLKTDIASRFGNLNNSVFFDNLNSIENNRANAISNLAQDVEAQRNELYNNELANRYNYLTFLNALQEQINNNVLNYMGLAQNNSASGSSYNQNAYNAASKSGNYYNNLVNSALAGLQYPKFW